MIATQASQTALIVATQRAAHQVLDTPVVCSDPFAVPILGDGAETELRARAAELRSPSALPLRSSVVARSRYADDLLAAALARGVRQVVLVGAGLDTLAYRTLMPAGTRVVEADHPATQDAKKRSLAGAGIDIPDALAYLPLDLEATTLRHALAGSGLDAERPAFFICLGLLYYLGTSAALGLLSDIGGWARGSEVVFDYFAPVQDDDPGERPGFDELARDVDSRGEPWKSTFEPDDLARRLGAAGFMDVDDLGSAAMTTRYFAGRADGLAPVGPIHFVRAAN